MKTMGASPTQRARRWVAPALVVGILVGLLSVAALIAVLGAGRTTVSAVAAPQPPLAPVTRTVRVPRSGAGPIVRGYKVPWEYGPGPMVGHRVEVSGVRGPRWLLGLVVIALVLLVAALLAALAWVLLRRRTGRASEGGAQEILERRLAEGSVDVEEFEKRREALRGSNRPPG
jgi:uncharacterized membrane protein